MTPSESAFLERSVVQLLFVSGREFSIEGLRETLRELFVQEAHATVRAAASGGSFELLQVLLKTTQKLEKLGLRLDMRAGGVRITTAEVRPPALRNYFATLAEHVKAELTASNNGSEEAEEAGLCDTPARWAAARSEKPSIPCWTMISSAARIRAARGSPW